MTDTYDSEWCPLGRLSPLDADARWTDLASGAITTPRGAETCTATPPIVRCRKRTLARREGAVRQIQFSARRPSAGRRTTTAGGAVTPTWIGAALGLECALTSRRGGGSPRPERFVS